LTYFSELANMPKDEAETVLIWELGVAALELIGKADRCGHVTIKGHLQYHHEDRQTIRGMYIHWLRHMTAWGNRDEIGCPQELMTLANWWVAQGLAIQVNEAVNNV